MFSTGLQIDLIKADLVNILGGGAATGGRLRQRNRGPWPGQCLPRSQDRRSPTDCRFSPAAIPIYRNGELVGALGISGDGMQQDALIAYLGIQGDASVGALGAGNLANAPAAIRADNPARVSLTPQVGSQPFTPLYVTCPPAPFLTSREQTPCD